MAHKYTPSGYRVNQRAVYAQAIYQAPPGSISVKQLQGYYVQAVRQTAKEGVNLVENLISTWGHRYDVHIRSLPSHIAGGNLVTEIEIDDDTGIFFFLDEGTSERWAQMRRGFIPKTSYRNLTPYQGYNTVPKIRGKKAMMKLGIPAQPGIEAREFTVELKARMESSLASRVSRAITLTVYALGGYQNMIK